MENPAPVNVASWGKWVVKFESPGAAVYSFVQIPIKNDCDPNVKSENNLEAINNQLVGTSSNHIGEVSAPVKKEEFKAYQRGNMMAPFVKFDSTKCESHLRVENSVVGTSNNRINEGPAQVYEEEFKAFQSGNMMGPFVKADSSSCGERYLTCSPCDRMFSEYDLSTHMQMPHTCNLCGQVFATASFVAEHLKTHMPYVCNKCGLVLTTKSRLNKHLRLHFRCHDCNAVFPRPEALARHIRGRPKSCEHFLAHKNGDPCTYGNCRYYKLHTQQKIPLPFECGECDKGFDNARDLARHVIASH